ncbi:MAG: hypothetical protein NC079_09485 [Clostridium sp.]|nr:hypothetical protein [Acetatifactor muris]MCM1527583.1 hypothetical protein [Bacteroides sp.]MCM1563824.1 hypothetical protein [Clostridium sp.]
MKHDRWFSVIMAVAMLGIGLVCLFRPIDYFKHLADAIIFPLFLFPLLEVVGHIKNSLFQYLDFEQEKAITDERWRRGYYNSAKDGESEEDRRIQKEYNDLVDYIIQLDIMKRVFERWLKFYNILYILFGVFLVFSVLLANLEFAINISSKMNGTALTLFTFVIFVSEPWLVESISDKLVNFVTKRMRNGETLYSHGD